MKTSQGNIVIYLFIYLFIYFVLDFVGFILVRAHSISVILNICSVGGVLITFYHSSRLCLTVYSEEF